MKLEEAKKICRLLCGKKNKKGKRIYETFTRMNMQLKYSTDDMAEAIETILQALENSIPKQVIEDKIKEYEELVEDFEKTDNSGRFKRTKSIDYYKLEAFKELLEDK